MADISEAVNCIQDLIDVANCHGSAYVYKRNGGVGRLENVLACLNEKQKSADEMFHELGYSLGFTTGVPYKNTTATNPAGGNWTAIEIKNGCAQKWGFGPKGGFHRFSLTTKECIACAQLIREMEAEK